MKAIEFMKLMHPNMVNMCANGGCYGCPEDYGIQLVPEPGRKCCMSNCNYCWNSEVESWNTSQDKLM